MFRLAICKAGHCFRLNGYLAKVHLLGHVLRKLDSGQWPALLTYTCREWPNKVLLWKKEKVGVPDSHKFELLDPDQHSKCGSGSRCKKMHLNFEEISYIIVQMPFLTLIFFRSRAHNRTDAGRGGKKRLPPPPTLTQYHQRWISNAAPLSFFIFSPL
jgi:hypothetical protein